MNVLSAKNQTLNKASEQLNRKYNQCRKRVSTQENLNKLQDYQQQNKEMEN